MAIFISEGQVVLLGCIKSALIMSFPARTITKTRLKLYLKQRKRGVFKVVNLFSQLKILHSHPSKIYFSKLRPKGLTSYEALFCHI